MTIINELTIVESLLKDVSIAIKACEFNQPEVAAHMHRISEILDDISEKVFPNDDTVMTDRMMSGDVPDIDPDEVANLVDYIGTPAMLEQLSEECCELGKASLKMARELRGENKTHKKYDDIWNNLIEEISDVKTSIYQVVKSSGLCTYDDIHKVMIQKNERMRNRLKSEKKNTVTVRFNNNSCIKRYKITKED